MRAGAQTLTLLGTPRIVLMLQALADGPQGQLDLRRAAGSPAQSTLRGHLKALEQADAIAKHNDSLSGALRYQLTQPGNELLSVMPTVELWLSSAPAGPLALDSDPARAAIRGLVDSWLAEILAPLSERPLSLTELDKRLPDLSYPAIERRLETLRLAEQIRAGERSGSGTPYETTPWLRLGVAALVAAARWEHRNQIDGATPITRFDVESVLKIITPLLGLNPSSEGICQIAVRENTRDGKRRRFLGVIVLAQGNAVFGPVYPRRRPDAWASGTRDDWFAAVIDGEASRLRTSGERQLIEAVLDRAHKVLFAQGPEARVILGEVR